MDSQTASKTITISILGIEENNDDLILSDGGETDANESDKIVWDIATSQVAEITNIQRKAGSDDVFDPNEQPQKEHGTKKWKGKIKEKVKVKITEYYSIYYKKSNNKEDKVYEYDPKISANPS